MTKSIEEPKSEIVSMMSEMSDMLDTHFLMMSRLSQSFYDAGFVQETNQVPIQARIALDTEKLEE